MDKRKKREQRKREKAAWESRKEEKRVDAEVAKQTARFPLQVVRAEAKERPCGECQECCMAVAVHEIGKPMWTQCEHQCSSGCGIYSERPESCRSYYCMWQAGFLKDEENRPDKLGIIFDFRSEGNVDTVSAWEIREGAADTPKVRRMIDDIVTQMGAKVVICVRRYKSSRRRFIGPAHLLSGMVVTEHN